jgi:simple sugar transport system ATP-binding protein
MVSQHYGIIPELTCLQNLMLGAEGGPVINPAAAAVRAEELATRMGFAFQWHRKTEGLSPAGAQKLEILKLLWRNARIMILDEPTAMLSPADGDALFKSLKLLTGQGATVILVTHRLPEVLDHCSRVTVLRAGARVAEKEVKDTNGRQLAQLIVGGALAEAPARTGATGAEVMSVRNLVVRGKRGDDALKGINLAVRAGQIVGIAGVDGSGQRELFHVLAGMLRPQSGELSLNGKDISHDSPARRLAAGLRIIPEDRHEEGVIEDWSLEENASLGLQRLKPFAAGPTVDAGGRQRAAAAIAERFATKHGGLKMPMQSLSGGNQQRFVAARALFLEPKLLLAFQPARGLDLNSTTRVYEGIRKACEEGAAALVVSFDLDELLEYCDRVVAMNRGELHEPSADKALDRDTIGRLMVGAA